MLSTILAKYGIQDEFVVPFGSGLINHTWKVTSGEKEYILQRINHDIFREPLNIAHNLRTIGEYLQVNHPAYPFVMPEATLTNEDVVCDKDYGYFRMFPFVKDSHTIDVIAQPEQAYEAAKQFGKFTRLLSGMDVGQLKITLPDFHNIRLRYTQFLEAVKNGNSERVEEMKESIDFIKENIDIVLEFESLELKQVFKKRVAHHDTKISNVLFNQDNEGIYVIDLDTVMPGYFISDVGDMLRTYLSPAGEEEQDLSKIHVRDDFFEVIRAGYLQEMKDILTEEEKKQFVFAGKYMIYMQAIRFLTDYLNNDAYYGSKYEGHNKTRACNQITLLKALMEKEKIYQAI